MDEHRLAESLEPIRNMFLSQVMLFLFESGLYDVLKENCEKDTTGIANKLDFSPYRLEGLMVYLKHEGIIELTEQGAPVLTVKGLEFGPSKPWYQLLVGGYGQTLKDLDALMSDRDRYGTRDGAYVGKGSCGISQFDALPMAKELIEEVHPSPEMVVDIGCGDGSYLVDLCKQIPHVKAIGLEPDAESVKIAKLLVDENDLGNRIEVRSGDFSELSAQEDLPSATVFIIAFVLQEVLEQSGRSTVINVLRQIRSLQPNSNIVVVEVDRDEENSEKMTSKLGLGYYNPYFLIHRLTEQRLERPDFWREVFEEAGWRIKMKTYPRPDYDPLALKIGFLLV